MTDASHVDLERHAPDFTPALVRATAAAKEGLDPITAELVLIRASQLNHCAYCVDMHTKGAAAAGISEQRIRLLAAWEEAGTLYSQRERAALTFTEAGTLMAGGRVPKAVHDEVARHFDPGQLACIAGLIAVINAWNRVSVLTGKTPQPDATATTD